MTETLFQAFTGTSWGVYGLLGYLLFIGSNLIKPHITSLRTLFITPLILTACALKIDFSFFSSLFCYFTGVLLGSFLTRKKQIGWDTKTKKVKLPRSFLLALLLSFYFSAYYTHLLESFIPYSVAGIFLGHFIKIFFIKRSCEHTAPS